MSEDREARFRKPIERVGRKLFPCVPNIGKKWEVTIFGEGQFFPTLIVVVLDPGGL